MNPLSSAQFDIRRALAWGATWSLAVAVCEALAMSPERWASPQLLLWWLTYWVIPLWCIVGTLQIWLLAHRRRPVGWRGALIAFLVPALLALLDGPLSTGMMNVSIHAFPKVKQFAIDTGVVPYRETWEALGCYALWVYLFYGSLLMAAWTLTVRRERLRSLLHASAMARSRTESLLDTERLQSLQAQIDPALLLESMRELEQRYRTDPDCAERLLEALVEFLRLARRGLRLAESTVEAEIELARAYAELQRVRGIAGAWRIVSGPAAAHGRAKFPSLLMLPLLSLGGTGGRPLLRTRFRDAHTVMEMIGLTRGVSADLRQQLQSRLRGLYGAGFTLECLPCDATRLTIVLNRAPTSS
jgi:hypothetical protein